MLHSEYIREADNAISHVKSKVRYRGLNTLGGLYLRHPLENPLKTIARLASKALGAVRSARYGGSCDAGDYIKETARLAIETHTGNCSELSSVAFLFLNARHIRPIEYFKVQRGNWGHAFVILNRDGDIPISKFKDWSPTAVLCDPLYDRYGEAGWLETWYPRMFPLKDTDLWLRFVE